MTRLTVGLMFAGLIVLLAGCPSGDNGSNDNGGSGEGNNGNDNSGSLAVDAGSDLPVDAGDSVGLSSSVGGLASDETVTYSWTQIGDGPRVELNGADTASAWFEAPDVDATRDFEVLTFEVTATTSGGEQATDTVVVTVRP